MGLTVAPYTAEWNDAYEAIARSLARALNGVPIDSIEHVGSTSVPGLAAKPIIDIDVVVQPEHMQAALSALAKAGYEHRGDRGLPGREAVANPPLADGEMPRNIYVCVAGCAPLRNHLAVRDVLRARSDLREEYAATKLALAADPNMDIFRYLEGKSAVLQKILRAAPPNTFTDAELEDIFALNTNPEQMVARGSMPNPKQPISNSRAAT